MINRLYVSWQRNPHESRHIIAKIERTPENNALTFDYLPEFDEAKQKGLSHFFGFKNVANFSPQEIEKMLSLRVISPNRKDKDDFLRFWEAENVTDMFDVLALTQGKSPTDNFEFLADYETNTQPIQSFITDLAGVYFQKLDAGSIYKGEILSFQKEPHNEFDKEAVAVYKGTLKLGYIKRVHNRVFHNPLYEIRLSVKSFEQNGTIKQIMAKVEVHTRTKEN